MCQITLNSLSCLTSTLLLFPSQGKIYFTLLDLSGPDWTGLDLIEPDLTQVDEIGQNCPDWAQVGLIGLN